MSTLDSGYVCQWAGREGRMRRAGSPPVHRYGVSTAAEPWWGVQSWRPAGPPSWGHGAGMHMSVVVGAGVCVYGSAVVGAVVLFAQCRGA